MSAVTLVSRTCLVLTCDVCGDGWDALAAEPHFATRREALTYASSAGWVVTGRRAVCVGCTPAELCGIGGHAWGGWTDAGPFVAADGGTWRGRVRYCGTCTAADWDPPLRAARRSRSAG